MDEDTYLKYVGRTYVCYTTVCIILREQLEKVGRRDVFSDVNRIICKDLAQKKEIA